VFNRRLALDIELGNESLECREVIDLIERVGLMKTVWGISECYEKLVKEFLVSIPEDCDNHLNKEYQQIFIRGKCVEFSPIVINRFL
jgi:hypothetical protein